MKKLFLIFIFSLFCFLPREVFATEINSSTLFSDLTVDEIANWASHYSNFDNYVMYENAIAYWFYPLFDDEVPYYSCSSSTTCNIFLRSSSRGLTNNYSFARYSYQFQKSAKVLSQPGLYAYTTSQNVGTSPTLYASTDILNNDDTVYLSKNKTFSKASCPTCEVCEECEECDNMNIDFPITKEEFYILLIFLAVIILLIFFKWTFGERGRK